MCVRECFNIGMNVYDCRVFAYCVHERTGVCLIEFHMPEALKYTANKKKKLLIIMIGKKIESISIVLEFGNNFFFFGFISSRLVKKKPT